MVIDVLVENVLEKTPGLTDRGMFTGVCEIRMVTGGLKCNLGFLLKRPFV